MKVENVKAIRDLAKSKNLPLTVVCDNEHYFVDNSDDTFSIEWDDANETFTVLQPATDNYYTQSVLPVRIVRSEYDHIQFMEVLLDRVTALERLKTLKEQGKITEDQYEKDYQLISKCCATSTLSTKVTHH